MKFDIKFEENSLHDFNSGLVYYQLISEGLVERFNDEFWICIEKLLENPRTFQMRYLNIRIVQVDKFPFSIHFFIEENTIYVQRVIHNKREY